MRCRVSALTGRGCIGVWVPFVTLGRAGFQSCMLGNLVWGLFSFLWGSERQGLEAQIIVLKVNRLKYGTFKK